MDLTLPERRQIENEMIFRRANEKIGIDLDAIDALHIEDGNPHLVRDVDIKLHFQCECSDENCTLRIPMLLSKYKEIHTDRSTFIIIPDHEVEPIEKVIEKADGYSVVKKHNTTPEPGPDLNVTTIDNSNA
jgi:hypothetical protein